MKIATIDNCNIYHFKSGLIFPFQLDIYFYLADGLLIDAGSSNILSQAKKYLRNKHISAVAITHLHEDHAGIAAWLQTEKKVPIYIPANAITVAARDSTIPLYRRVVWGNRKGFSGLPIPAAISTEHYSFDVYDAPGHCKDHVVLHEKNMGWLFTGDLFVSTRQLVALKEENIADEITSLQKLIALDFDTVFCSHSGVNINGKEKLKRKLEFFLSIQQQVRLLKQKGLTDVEIDKKLFPKRNLWTLASGGEWSSLNIIKTVD